ncbi:MAG: ATP-binding protein [bacterium]|jgi:signal transduction histidine kinase|nr:ATP-binding protein [bacterium]
MHSVRPTLNWLEETISPMSDVPHKQEGQDNLSWLIKTYFADPLRRITLGKGEILMNQYDYNDRLYLVRSGKLKGYINLPNGDRYETFEATRNMFVGAPSFFSKTFSSLNTVIAEEKSELQYIDSHQPVVINERGNSLVEQFMPSIIHNLVQRQQRIQKIAQEKERSLKALIHTEKMASLGKISAGIAHELNNAISVLKRNTEWLSKNLAESIAERHPEQFHFYEKGFKDGRQVSSLEARRRAKQITEDYQIEPNVARRLAQTGISDEILKGMQSILTKEIDIIDYYWEIGATLKDMLIAAEHAMHVVRSVKALGAQQPDRQHDLELNDCIKEALTLLASPLRKVSVNLHIEPTPPIYGNKGEIVQMLINIIQNACESMAGEEITDPSICIATFHEGPSVLILITDSGPGIPASILPRIFEPTLSTKKEGKIIGLGLGLTIVKRLVDSYHGKISVQSQPGKTTFTVRLPILGGEHVYD